MKFQKLNVKVNGLNARIFKCAGGIRASYGINILYTGDSIVEAFGVLSDYILSEFGRDVHERFTYWSHEYVYGSDNV